MFSFYSDDSFEYIEPKILPTRSDKNRPRAVPALNLESIPDYQTSSDDEDENDEVPNE